MESILIIRYITFMFKTLLVPLLFVLFPISLYASSPEINGPHAAISLHYKSENAEGAGVLAVHFQLESHWHIYWVNPGDAGLSPKITWETSPGITVDSTLWPIPHRIEMGGIVNYGYEDSVSLLSPIRFNSIPSKGVIRAKVSYLICQEECLPETAEAELHFPIAISQDTIGWGKSIERYTKAVPFEKLTTWQVIRDDSLLYLQFSEKNHPQGKQPWFYPLTTPLIAQSELQIWNNTTNILTVKLDPYLSVKPVSLEGVLVWENATTGEQGPSGTIDALIGTKTSGAAGFTQYSGKAILLSLALAFLGGMILNLMPCVLPVLSIKVLHLISDAHSHARKTWVNGLWYTLGVSTAFWILACLLIVLRSAGAAIGWGFHLQSPLIVSSLALLFVALGLNLLGVFEIGLVMTRLGSKEITTHKGSQGLRHFWSGILATVVATPCTAPFMGTALGLALTAETYVTLLIFTFLGLGMAFPLLLITLIPGLQKVLPKPGLWMERFKQILGFPLLATALWLTTVLLGQWPIEGIVYFFISVLVMAFGLWIYGTWGQTLEKSKSRLFARLLTIFLLGLTIYLIVQTDRDHRFKQNDSKGIGALSNQKLKIGWENYSPIEVEKALQNGEAVFIDYTADWCLSCKVNERVALHSEKVKKAFDSLAVRQFVADWTNRNETITASLAQFGRAGVPLYIYYPAGEAKNPRILPSLLTPDIVLKEIGF